MITSSHPIADSRSKGDALIVAAPRFYVVSRKKLAVLFMATVGLYSVYWFYKNWSNYKQRAVEDAKVDRSIWPVPRGIFAIFFTHALFQDIKYHGRDKAALARWDNKALATKLVATMIVSNIVDRLSYRGIGSPFTDIASLLILVPLLTQFLNAQQMINAACDDPDGESNSRFTEANYAWIVVGVLYWSVIFIAAFMPE